jgi:FkbM family methyltransferase
VNPDSLIAQLELDLANRSGELERTRVQLDIERRGRHDDAQSRNLMQRRIDGLGVEARRLAGRVAELEGELASTYASASWRVTSPLRRLRGSARPSEIIDDTANLTAMAAHGVFVRIGTSDVEVFRQVFEEIQYGIVPEDLEFLRVIDCGANVGYTTMFFLDRYPAAHVTAIEPDPDNARMARLNLSKYGSRATLLEAAVWPHDEPLRLRRSAFRDGREWATQVEPGRGCEFPDVRRIDLTELIGTRVVDLLKVDIERSEFDLFSAPCPWMDFVRNLAIELHDDECASAFRTALASFTYQERRCGELTLCTGIHRSA